MNSEDPDLPDDEGDWCDTQLNLSAAKLDVYRHERLAYTEPPRKISRPRRKIANRADALLKAMATWALAHL